MTDEELYSQALASLKAKAEFRTHLVVYILVNGMLTIIWAVFTPGFFWPLFPMLGWGIGLGVHGWEAYGQRPPSDARVRREMERLH